MKGPGKPSEAALIFWVSSVYSSCAATVVVGRVVRTVPVCPVPVMSNPDKTGAAVPAV